MAERMRAAPGWREPAEAERQQILADLEASFREHGYPRLASACAEPRKKAP